MLGRKGRWILLSLGLVIACVGRDMQVANARLVAMSSVAANTFSTDALNPPIGLSGSGSIGNVTLSWTATPDTYAAGYRVLRSSTSGGPYSQVGGNVTPRTNTSFVDSPG